MTLVELIGFFAALAFLALSAIRNVVKQQQQMQRSAEQKAKKEAHKHTEPYKPVTKKQVIKERPFVEEFKIEHKKIRVQKKSSFPGGCSLRSAILSKEILDPPLALRER